MILQELEYAENSTFTYYQGYDVLNVSPSDVFSAAQYNWKQAAVAISISGLEQLQNQGRERQIDLLESRIGNAERTMANNIAVGLYGDGTGTGGKAIGGLQLLVADAPTSGTVGGISRSTWSFWQNQLFDFSVAGLTPGAATMQTAMNRAYLLTKRGRDAPDLWVGDSTYYRYYWESMQAIQRVTNDEMAQAGFANLEFMGAPVIPDGGIGGGAPANHMYGLNSQYIFYRPHADRDMVPLDADRYAVNQDALVKLIVWAGNMTLSNASLQVAIIA